MPHPNNSTPTQRLFKLAGWIIAVPVVLAAFWVAFAVLVVGGLTFGMAGGLIGLALLLALAGWTVKKVWKG